MKKYLIEIGIAVGVVALIIISFRMSKNVETALTERDIIKKELQISEETVKNLKADIDSVEKLLQASRMRQNESKVRQQQNIIKFNEEKDAFHRLDDGGHVIFWKREFSRKDTVPM